MEFSGKNPLLPPRRRGDREFTPGSRGTRHGFRPAKIRFVTRPPFVGKKRSVTTLVVGFGLGFPCLKFKLDSPGFLHGRFDVEGWELELLVRCERRGLEDILPGRCIDRE